MCFSDCSPMDRIMQDLSCNHQGPTMHPALTAPIQDMGMNKYTLTKCCFDIAYMNMLGNYDGILADSVKTCNKCTTGMHTCMLMA